MSMVEEIMREAAGKAPEIRKLITDPAAPIQLRKQLLMQLCSAGDDERQDAILASILEAAAAGSSREQYVEKTQQLAALIEEMKEGPLRLGTFLRNQDCNGSLGVGRRAQVLLPDGDMASCMIRDDELADQLVRGDTVWLEAQGKAILYREPTVAQTGEEARLERRLGADRVEVTLRDQGRFIFHTSARLIEQLDAGEAEPGTMVIVCTQRMMAFVAVPKRDEFSRFEFLERAPVPDVLIERDIGSPPEFLDDLTEHLLIEMQDPALGRKHGQRAATMLLLEGVSGSGKTHCIQGFWRRMYEVASEVTGTPIDELPPRVLRLRCAAVLSKWLGEADKRIDRFFDEVKELARQPFKAADGAEYTLPLLVICEEVDGLARERGHDAIYDRIQTTLLERLDTTTQGFREELVFFICTTNVPHIVDPAFMRRAGGTVEHFGRLGRQDFVAVLDTHLRGRCYSTALTAEPGVMRSRVIGDLVAWLYSPNGADPGQVELTYVGSAEHAVKFRRDFLTCGLVDRAVQQAVKAACRDEFRGVEHAGLDTERLMTAFDRQVSSIVEQLRPENVSNYLTLPEGVRVGSVQKIRQPAMLPVELEQAS